jgi:hypothetical protein
MLSQGASLNASTTDSKYHNVSLSGSQGSKPSRPMLTPATSFRGSSVRNDGGSWNQGVTTDTTNMQSSTQTQTGAWSDSSMRSTSRGRRDNAESNAQNANEYSAFQDDAFAPLQSAPSNPQHPFHGSADPWAAFRSKLPTASGAFHTGHSQTWGQTTHQQAPWHQPTLAGNTTTNY